MIRKLSLLMLTLALAGTLALAQQSPDTTQPADAAQQPADTMQQPADTTQPVDAQQEAGQPGDLQAEIDAALHNEASLAGSQISVNVTADSVELSGSVQNEEQRAKAREVVSSIAGDRKIVDNLTVSGEGEAAPQEAPPQYDQPQE